jgi:hypothetical protein
MNAAQRKTLEAIFSTPVPLALEWQCVETGFVHLGARLIEGDGSRVRFMLNDVVGIFHRPHPARQAKRYQVRDARAFLEKAGIQS